MQGNNATQTQEAIGSEGEWENFKRKQKTSAELKIRDKPLLLFRRPGKSVNRAIGKPTYSYWREK